MTSSLPRDAHFPRYVDPDGVEMLDVLAFTFADFPEFMRDREVKTVVIDDSIEGMPDLLSFIEFGVEDYWWVICLLNAVRDPFGDFPVGTEAALPRASDVESFIASKRDTPARARLVRL